MFLRNTEKYNDAACCTVLYRNTYQRSENHFTLTLLLSLIESYDPVSAAVSQVPHAKDPFISGFPTATEVVLINITEHRVTTCM